MTYTYVQLTFPRKTPTIRGYIRKTKTNKYVSTLGVTSSTHICDITGQIVLRCILSFLLFCGTRIPHVVKVKVQHDRAHFIKMTCLILRCNNTHVYRKSRSAVIGDVRTRCTFPTEAQYS